MIVGVSRPERIDETLEWAALKISEAALVTCGDAASSCSRPDTPYQPAALCADRIELAHPPPRNAASLLAARHATYAAWLPIRRQATSSWRNKKGLTPRDWGLTDKCPARIPYPALHTHDTASLPIPCLDLLVVASLRFEIVSPL